MYFQSSETAHNSKVNGKSQNQITKFLEMECIFNFFIILCFFGQNLFILGQKSVKKTF